MIVSLFIYKLIKQDLPDILVLYMHNNWSCSWKRMGIISSTVDRYPAKQVHPNLRFCQDNCQPQTLDTIHTLLF